VCFKLFATSEYLVGHYKRRHYEYYTNEIRPQEDRMLKQELGEYVRQQGIKEPTFDEKEMVAKIKEDVVDHFNSNFVHLQQEVQGIRNAEKQHIQNLESNWSVQLPKQAEKISSALDSYKDVLNDL